MRRTILLIGNSPLLYFVAKELNKEVAREVENNVIWLTSEKYLHDLSVNRAWYSPKGKIAISKGLENIKLVRGDVKSISLGDKRVVSSKAVLEYDLLVVDQMSTYTFDELQAIKKATTDLLLDVKAAQNQDKPMTARIICKGDSAESLELACRISELIRTDFPRLVRYVGVDIPIIGNQKAALNFINDNNLYEMESRKADSKLTLEQPRPLFPLSKIRGLRVGVKGYALVESDLQAKGQKNIFIIDGQNRNWQNLLHFQKSAAKRIAGNIEAALEGKKTLPVELAEKGIFLSANNSVFVELGDMVSNRTRARIVSRLEHRLFRSLQN